MTDWSVERIAQEAHSLSLRWPTGGNDPVITRGITDLAGLVRKLAEAVGADDHDDPTAYALSVLDERTTELEEWRTETASHLETHTNDLSLLFDQLEAQGNEIAELRDRVADLERRLLD
jgi:hypothetical protein